MEKVAVLPVPDCAWAMTSLPRTLSVCEFVVKYIRGRRTLDHRHDGALLDGRRALEAVGVDSAQELALEIHSIEAVGGLIVVGLDLGWRGEQTVSQKASCSARGRGASRLRVRL